MPQSIFVNQTTKLHYLFFPEPDEDNYDKDGHCT